LAGVVLASVQATTGTGVSVDPPSATPSSSAMRSARSMLERPANSIMRRNDVPSRELLRELEIEHRDELCGVFQGVAITEPELEPGRTHSDQVLLFREGILSAAMDDNGIVHDDELRKAEACIIWSSALGVRALTLGIRVFYDSPHWICEQAAQEVVVVLGSDRGVAGHCDGATDHAGAFFLNCCWHGQTKEQLCRCVTDVRCLLYWGHSWIHRRSDKLTAGSALNLVRSCEFPRRTALISKRIMPPTSRPS
jgi:hypothetical protein